MQGAQGVQLTAEASLDPAGQLRGGQAEPAGQLGRGQSARQFQQRQRVAAGLGHDQVADPRVQRPGQRRVQQRVGQSENGRKAKFYTLTARGKKQLKQEASKSGAHLGRHGQCPGEYLKFAGEFS